MSVNPNILVIGDGAVGRIISGILFKKGYKVTIVAKDNERAARIVKEGFEITGVCGDIKTTIPAFGSIMKIKKRPDYVLIATKAHDLVEVAKQLQPLLPDECLVVSLQNGIVEEELAKEIGWDRTVGCIVGWGATQHPTGILEMSSGGEFVIGYIHKQKDQKLENLAGIMSEILPVEISENILNHLYSKLIINACITTIGAICGLTLGKMLIKKQYRSLFINIISEAVNVANAMKIEVAPYAGKLNYYKFLRWNNFRQNVFLLAFGFKYRRLKSSSLQSLERGKRTEVKYFNGYISEKGSQFKIPTPLNDLLSSLVFEIEEGKREISESNLF